MCIFLVVHSLLLLEIAGVEKDALQRPVERSQVLTTPASSTKIATLSFACKLMVMGGDEVFDGFLLVATGSVGMGPICQNLIDLSMDDEMREDENDTQVILSVCPMKVLMR